MLENEVGKVMFTETTTNTETEPPAEKGAKKGILKCFDEVIKEAGSTISYSAMSLVDLYFNEPLVPITVEMLLRGGVRTKQALSHSAV